MIDRKCRLRGHAQLQLIEGIHMAYNGTTAIERRDNGCFDGTNRSDSLGPVHMQKLSEVPSLPREKVIEFWGERYKPVGGRNPGSDGEEASCEEDNVLSEADDAEQGGDDDSDGDVPTAHHQLPAKVYENMFHTTWAKSIIDLCVGTGVQALTAIKMQLGYIGLCHSEAQREYVFTYLHNEVLKLMADSTATRFYNVSYAKMLKSGKVPAAGEADDDDDGDAGAGDDVGQEDEAEGGGRGPGGRGEG